MPCGSSKEVTNQQEKAAENGHCEFEDLDHSILQQPLNLGVTNVKQILKCIQSGSKEIKDIILNECNVIYECKACFGLFRSLANFMYHKRCYCKKHLCEDMVLFENFDENSQTVIFQQEVSHENSEKISQKDSITPKLLECTVDLVKADFEQEMKSALVNDTAKSSPQTSDTCKEQINVSTSNKGRGRSNSDGKKVSEIEKVENSMVSRRTREKNAQKSHITDESKILKAAPDEPPQKYSKVLSKEMEDIELSCTEIKTDTLVNSGNKITKPDKTEIAKYTSMVEKNIPSGPKIIFKPIEGNPNAVFQCSEKAKPESVKVDKVVQTKVDNEKLIIVLKKDIKVLSSSDSKSAASDKPNKDCEKQTEFHLTRRKRLMNRNDCNVQELKCLVCKTQFMSLKTLYFHMLSLHSRKRLYYPCPFCKTLFVQMYGVTRHLVSIHNKTKEQVNKLRDVIKKKGVWKKVDDVNSYNESVQSPVKNETYEIRQDSKTGNKIGDNALEGNNTECSPLKTIIKLGKNVTLYKCSKCNRVFGRKSSQVSHEKFCIMNAIKVETVDLTLAPTKDPSPTASFLPLSSGQISPDQNENRIPIQPAKQILPDVKISVRPKRGAEKQMHKDFVNSQTLKWRSANRLDMNSKTVPAASKKISGKNLEKKVLSIMNVENLLCQKCDKKFSSYSNLRRHVAIHVGWFRFKCKYCDYQAYNKSQCWTHIQKAHSVSDGDMEKSIVSLVGSNMCSKKSVNQFAQNAKRNIELGIKYSPPKNNAIPKMKISKKKNATSCIKISEKKHINKKESTENKRDMPDSKKEASETKKEKNLNITHIHKYAIPEYKKETTNYKSVTTSNPTTIILSKKIPSSTVQSFVTISTESVSSTSPTKISPIRSSPRKNDPKVPEEKPVAQSLVTRSTAYTKSPIQIKLPVRPTLDDIKKDCTEKVYGKKERLISEWFPKKDLNSNNTRRESAPLIIGLVPASGSGLNIRTKNPGIAFERNGS